MSLIRYLAVAGLTVAVALPTVAHIEKTEPMQSRDNPILPSWV